ncbi:MAG: DUF1570 domain-containing protein [bacterium]|nr:DUF1570 domain-containing protein [bacterium]
MHLAHYSMLLFLAGTQEPSTPPLAVTEGIARARECMADDAFVEARDVLQELARDHAGEPALLMQRRTVADLLARSTFWSQERAIDANALTSGEIVSYKPVSGRMELHYAPRWLEDFDPPYSEGVREMLTYLRHRPKYVHQAIFDGPYTIEFRGLAGKELTPPWIDVCIQGDEAYRIHCSYPTYAKQTHWAPTSIERIAEGRMRVLDRVTLSPKMIKDKWVVRIDVQRTKITVRCNGRRLLETKKEADLYGQFGFSSMAGALEVRVKGNAEAAWIQSVVGAEVQERWEEFEKDFELPETLQADVVEAREIRDIVVAYAQTETALARNSLERTLKFLDKQAYRSGLNVVRKMSKRRMKPALRHYFLARFQRELGQGTEALESARRAIELDPDFFLPRLEQALALSWTDTTARAAEECRAVVADFPEEPMVLSALAQMLLFSGGRGEVRQIIADALAREDYTGELAAVDGMLTKIDNGPNWREVHEHRSKNFVVASDIDARTCEEASQVLEVALARYQSALPAPAGASLGPYSVYLFSCEEGFRGYFQDISGVRIENAAGLYSPWLDQLLIWNLPEHDEMMQTVRHEGLHQYLDSIMSDPPSWFNEGLAEVYEVADFTKLETRQFLVNRRHIDTLAELELVPLDEFLYQAPSEFYADSRAHYAQAWAFVHFLLHADRDTRLLFQGIFETLIEEGKRETALERAFADTGLGGLQRRFEAYVDDLTR